MRAGVCVLVLVLAHAALAAPPRTSPHSRTLRHQYIRAARAQGDLPACLACLLC